MFQTEREFRQFLAQADFAARSAVFGTEFDPKANRDVPCSGRKWSDRMLAHPLVREAIPGHWDHDLKSYLVATIKRRIIDGKSWTDLDDLMPPRDQIRYWRQHGKDYREAAEWREAQLPCSNLRSLIKSIDAQRKATQRGMTPAELNAAVAEVELQQQEPTP